jgi:protein tyrosine phosphatase (PTP) superfamily phosphohydrolase (DUF442 family)
MVRLISGLTLAGAVALAVVGCNHCNRQQNTPSAPPPGSGPYLGAPTPAPGTQFLPEAPVPPAPVGGQFGVVPSQSRSFDSQGFSGDLNWKPGTGMSEYTAPSIRLYPPEVDENPDADKKPQQAPAQPPQNPTQPQQTPKPLPKADENFQTKEPPTAKPIGIQQFALAQAGVANGLRPSLDDGLDWLKASGYKTVLFVHEPGEPEGADRKQIEKRGLKFVGLGVSPSTLTKQIADEFIRIVGDSSEGPLFVYDRDGALTGALWYLNFRIAQQASDGSARNQAHRLGLQEENGGMHAEMWQAAKRLADGIQP